MSSLASHGPTFIQSTATSLLVGDGFAVLLGTCSCRSLLPSRVFSGCVCEGLCGETGGSGDRLGRRCCSGSLRRSERCMWLGSLCTH